MSKLLSPSQCRFAIQFCAATAVAALLSGCSADSNRFNDAFGNPFATGSTEKPHKVSTLSHPVGTGRTPPVVATALPPRAPSTASAAPASAPVMVSRESTGSIAPAHSVPNASFGGWTGQGGASVQVSQGDTAEMLAKRYGVPQNILLQVNGLKSPSDVQPGITIVVPVYNAVATLPQAQAPRVAVASPAPLVHPRSAPVPRVAQAEPEVDRAAPAAARAAPAARVIVAKAAPATRVIVAKAEPVATPVREAPARKVKLAPPAPAKLAAAAPTRITKALKAATADVPVAKSKAAAREAAAPVVVKVVPVKVAAAVAAKPLASAPKVAAKASVAPAPKVEQAIDRKVIDPTPTASLPPPAAAPPAAAAAPAAVVADAGGPEFRWPARGRIIQGFKGGAGGNDGINIAVPEGTAVKAAEGGVVAYAGSELKGYGNLVLIRHPNGYVTAYANNGEIDVKRGETVKRGQMIAKSGQSGNVSSPQLHFELRKGSQPVDPTSYLAGL